METVSLYSAAKNIISGFKNNEDNSLVLENWKTLASALNQFPTYAEIPYIPDVPLAMYMYVMKYTSKRSEENSIRAITTFGVLMNAIEHTDDVDKHGYLALIASLISYYKKHFDNLNNFSLFPISIPQEKEDFNRILVDYGDTTAYFDSIFLYIYNLIDNDSQSFFGNDEIKRKYIAYKESFLNEYNQKEHGTEENLNGNRVLRDCYDRMNQIGKCPIYVPSSTNSDIYNKTYGLIPHGLTFFASKFFMQETTGNMSEGELNMQIKIDIQDDMMQTFCEGIDEHRIIMWQKKTNILS